VASAEPREAGWGVGCENFWLFNLEMVYFSAYVRYSDVLIIGPLGFNSAYLLCNQNVLGESGARPRFGGQLPPCPNIEPHLWLSLVKFGPRTTENRPEKVPHP